MYQLPQEIWNQIALQPEMLTLTYKRLFSMSEEQIEKEIENYYPVVIRIDPLLREHKAITAWINTQPIREREYLRMALPEVLNVEEALHMAEQELPLSKEQLTEFEALFKTSIP